MNLLLEERALCRPLGERSGTRDGASSDPWIALAMSRLKGWRYIVVGRAASSPRIVRRTARKVEVLSFTGLRNGVAAGSLCAVRAPGGLCKVSPPPVLVRRQPFIGPVGPGRMGCQLHVNFSTQIVP